MGIIVMPTTLEMHNVFRALLIERDEAGQQATRLTELDESLLPEGGVTVAVAYSTLNYKDGLAITGRAPVVRRFPMIPGIDFAGTVLKSDDPSWHPGDEVVLNGWGVGESHWGGLAERAWARGDWLIKRPAPLSAQQAMAIGTAGYTAMLCVLALEQNGVEPGSGEVLVTGAAGGVGSVAIALLARLGYQVVASTGRAESAEYLRKLGAVEVLARSTLSAPGKPLARERWAGVIDSVGSHTLANACASTRYGGVVAACGLAGGMDFPASVAPFILRGVTLCGIDSVQAPRAKREEAWLRLARDLDLGLLERMTTAIALEDAVMYAEKLMAGTIQGRLVVRTERSDRAM